METQKSILLSLMLISKRYICLGCAALSTLIIFDKLRLSSVNTYVILGAILIFLCMYFIFQEIIKIILDKNLKVETDYVLIQGFLRSPIFILEHNHQKMAIFRIESKSHSVFLKIEYNGKNKKGKYKEIDLENLTIKPNKEYFIGATQTKYVFKKMHYIESIIPNVIDFYELKKVYFKSSIKERRNKKSRKISELA